MRLPILAGLLLLGPGFVPARAADDKPNSNDLKEEVRKLVETARTKHGVPAVGVVVTSSKEVLALYVDGVRKAGTKVKVLPSDKFHLGSNTKSFTALLIAILVQKKKLSYDLTFEKAFPEFAKTMAPSFRKVTLDLLLRHRAGMPNDLPDWWIFSRNGTPREQRQALIKALFTDKKASVKPDEAFVYSNVGYVLATAMVEKKLGTSWEALVKQHVLAPLKITSAGFGPTTMNKLIVEQPWGHEEDGTPFEPSVSADNPEIMNPAGRLHLSLGDWAKFGAEILRGARGEKALLPAETYKKILEPEGKDEVYARAAWVVLRTAKGNLYMHDGSNTMNYASALVDPKRDYAVLVVCNQGKKKGEAACTDVRNAILKYMLVREAASAKKEP